MSLKLSISARTTLSKLLTLMRFQLAMRSTQFLCYATSFSLFFLAFYSYSRALLISSARRFPSSLSLQASLSSLRCTRMRFSSMSPFKFLRQVPFFSNYSYSFAIFSLSLALSALSSLLASLRSLMDSATLVYSLVFLLSLSSALCDSSNISSSIFSFSLNTRITSFCFSRLSLRLWYSLSFSLFCLGYLPVLVNSMILRLFYSMISYCFCSQFSQLVWMSIWYLFNFSTSPDRSSNSFSMRALSPFASFSYSDNKVNYSFKR